MDKKDIKYIFRRVLTFFIIFVILSFIKGCEVKAATGEMNLTNGINAITFSPSAQFYDNQSGSLVSKATSWYTDHFMTDDELTTNTSGYGAAIVFQLNETLVKGARYAITIYVENYNRVQLRYVERYGNKLIACYSQSNCISNFNNNVSNTIIQFAGNNLTNIEGAADYFGNVTAFTYIIDLQNNNANWLLLPYTSFSNSTAYNLFFGYNVTYLGLTDQVTNSSLQSIISSSGLATANSVTQVQTSITNMQTSISNSIDAQSQQQHQDSVNTQNAINNAATQAHQDSQAMQNTITDTSSPSNLNGLSQSAGWLPPGPVDSILNLPLSLLNNISDNLSKSCQPVVLTIPYVNSTLTLPCLNTLYDQMGVGPLLSFIGTIASCFILLSYLIKLYKWVDDTLTFRENNYIDNWGGI